jgi:mono/diheme cytochrome c family protein
MRPAFALLAGLLMFPAWTTGVATQTSTQTHPPGDHTHPDAAKLKNPMKPTPDAIAAGKAIYDQQCVNCHGEKGKGDGKLAPTVTGPAPSDFTDGKWKHGSSDGEIFTVIKEGVKGTGMRSFTTRIKTEDDIWNVVLYLKTLGPKSAKAR